MNNPFPDTRCRILASYDSFSRNNLLIIPSFFLLFQPSKRPFCHTQIWKKRVCEKRCRLGNDFNFSWLFSWNESKTDFYWNIKYTAGQTVWNFNLKIYIYFRSIAWKDAVNEPEPVSIKSFSSDINLAGPPIHVWHTRAGVPGFDKFLSPGFRILGDLTPRIFLVSGWKISKGLITGEEPDIRRS